MKTIYTLFALALCFCFVGAIHGSVSIPVELTTAEPLTTAREEIVTGVCTFGDCPVELPTTKIATEIAIRSNSIAIKKQSDSNNLAKQDDNLTIEGTVEYQEETEETEAETPSTYQNEEETYQEDYSGYIGRMYVTGYTAEEGFPLYSATSSGYGVRPGYCALNNSQRQALGISYGDQIYVEGLGTYTVMDCGCSWGVVDIWLYTNAEAYAITGYYDVYYA